jgi:hypothetical protein
MEVLIMVMDTLMVKEWEWFVLQDLMVLVVAWVLTVSMFQDRHHHIT